MNAIAGLFRVSRQGFTLIELLVVVAVIAVLAGMLVPVIGVVRENAVESQCASRMRQMGLVVTAYQGDNDGWFPSSAMIGGSALSGNGTTGGLETYFEYSTITALQASRAVRCPAMTRELSNATAMVSTANDRFPSNRNLWWSMNSDGTLQTGNGNYPPAAIVPLMTTSQIVKLSAFYVVFCGNGGWYAQTGYGPTNRWRPNFIHRPRLPVSTLSGQYYVYDDGYCNVVFGDGHVQKMTSGGSSNACSDRQIPLVSGGSSGAAFTAGWDGK